MQIRGYAAVFNSKSHDLGGFVEMIRPGAFAESLRRDDPLLLTNHDEHRLCLARKSAGTLRLSEDSHGLKIEADLPDTADGRALHAAIERRDVVGMSFGFFVLDDLWEQAGTKALRTINKICLLEVSVVNSPAYPQTSVSAVDLRKTARELIAEVEAQYGYSPRQTENDRWRKQIGEFIAEVEQSQAEIEARERARKKKAADEWELLRLRLELEKVR